MKNIQIIVSVVAILIVIIAFVISSQSSSGNKRNYHGASEDAFRTMKVQ